MKSEDHTGSWPTKSPRFTTTRWTMVLQAGGAGPARDAAMEQFCRAYWYPVYAFIRRRGKAPEDARDLTQAFFAKLIERDWLAEVERRETRFSTLLITILNNFLIKQHRHDGAQKRGGGGAPVSLDLVQAESWFGREPATRDTPESCFEKRWAVAVMEAAMDRLREECENTGKARIFAALGAFLARQPAAGEYEAAGEGLGINARGVAVAVHRLRQDFRAMVREEVAAGLRDEAMVQVEMQALAVALEA